MDMVAINGSRNFLTGTLNLSEVHRQMQAIDLISNRLHGSLDLGAFPRGFSALLLADNAFSGTLQMAVLANGLIRIDLSGNACIGSVSLVRVPPYAKVFRMQNTKLHIGKVVVVEIFHGELDLRGNTVGKVVYPSGESCADLAGGLVDDLHERGMKR